LKKSSAEREEPGGGRSGRSRLFSRSKPHSRSRRGRSPRSLLSGRLILAENIYDPGAAARSGSRKARKGLRSRQLRRMWSRRGGGDPSWQVDGGLEGDGGGVGRGGEFDRIARRENRMKLFPTRMMRRDGRTPIRNRVRISRSVQESRPGRETRSGSPCMRSACCRLSRAQRTHHGDAAAEFARTIDDSPSRAGDRDGGTSETAAGGVGGASNDGGGGGGGGGGSGKGRSGRSAVAAEHGPGGGEGEEETGERRRATRSQDTAGVCAGSGERARTSIQLRRRHFAPDPLSDPPLSGARDPRASLVHGATRTHHTGDAGLSYTLPAYAPSSPVGTERGLPACLPACLPLPTPLPSPQCYSRPTLIAARPARPLDSPCGLTSYPGGIIRRAESSRLIAIIFRARGCCNRACGSAAVMQQPQ